MTDHTLPDGRIPVLLSAHEEDLIGQDAAAILAYLGRCTDSDTLTRAVSATLLGTRRVRRHRALLRVGDRAELESGLAALADGGEHPLLARSSSTTGPRLAFVFPGQGGQWPSMGADAYRLLSAYRCEVDRCVAAFTAAGQPSPLPYLLGAPEQQWSQLHIQGAQFVHAAGLARVWRSYGVLPASTVGHSLGEVAAAYVAGAVTLPDAVAVVAARATVLDRLPGDYAMAVLGVGVPEAEQLIAESPGWLEVSVVNAPSSIVLSGDRDAVAAAARLAAQRGAFVRELAVDFPAHTSALERLRPTLEELLPSSTFLDAPVEFVGSATGAVVPAGTDFRSYWYANLRNTVRFDHAVDTAVQRGTGAFVEISAHPSVQYALTELLDPESDPLIVGSGRRDAPIVDELAANIVTAALAEPGYRWADLAGVAGVAERAPLPGFPNAPMRAVALWAAPEPLTEGAAPAGSGVVVAVEGWEAVEVCEPHPNSAAIAAASATPVALVAADPGAETLTAQLRTAVTAHPGCRNAPVAEAEITVIIAPALRHLDLQAATAALRRSGIPDYTALVGPRCRRVWLLTAGGEQAHPEDPPPLPAQAALAAAHRCVAFEFPDQAFGHLDVPLGELDAQTARACVDVLLGEVAETALRAGGSGARHRYRRTLRTRHRPAPALDNAALDNVVITGGNGALGRRFARRCIEHGARRVLLLSRTGLEPATLATLADGYPAAVFAPVCDITDRRALSAVAAEQAGAGGASLLIHTAGAARFARHDQLTEADLAAVFGAKVDGLAAITDIWPLRPDARILACSSISGVWGGHGHAAYAAANRMLDVAVGALRAQGHNCAAVRFGLWQDAGIVDADEVARIERSGLLAMDPEAALDAGLRDHHGDPLILAADFDRLRIFFESQGNPMPLAATEGDRDAEGDGDQPVADVVRSALAAVLNLNGPDVVDLNTALIDLGVDSLLALDLRKRLRRSTGRAVALASLLSGTTGAELIDVLSPTADTAPARSQREERLEPSRD